MRTRSAVKRMDAEQVAKDTENAVEKTGTVPINATIEEEVLAAKVHVEECIQSSLREEVSEEAQCVHY